MWNSAVLQRKLSTFLLTGALVLLVPVESFAGPREAPKGEQTLPASSLFELFRSVLVSLWNETGCSIDPNGHCSSASNDRSPSDKADTGSHIDPSGQSIM